MRANSSALSRLPSKPSWQARLDLAVIGMVAIVGVLTAAIFMLVGSVVLLSFSGDSLTFKNLTLEYYEEVFSFSAVTYPVLLNTVIFSVIALVAAIAIGLPIAWLVERTDMPGKGVISTMMTMALLIPTFAIAMGWLFLMHPRIGILNTGFQSLFGVSQGPFEIRTLYGMGFIEALVLAPVAFVMFSSALRSMNPSLEEAARASGAHPLVVVFKVSLPLIWPSTLALAIFLFIIGFAAFDIPAIIGMPVRIFTFSTLIYYRINPLSGVPDYGLVACLSVLMMAIGALLAWWYSTVLGAESRYAVISGKSYRHQIYSLGAIKIPALIGVSIYFVLSQLLPIAVLLWSSFLPFLQPPSLSAIADISLGNYRQIPVRLITDATINTAILMVIVPTISIAASMSFSWIVLRTKLKGRGAIDFIAFLPQTIPGIVFSVATLLIALKLLAGIVPLYGTVWGLIVVYVIARLGYATRMTNSALLQVHPELEEAARVSGASTASVLKSVILPLLSPTLFYAWLWVALLSYRELTLPLLLATTDSQVLTTVVWGYLSGSQYGTASSVSVLILTILAPIIYIYWWAAIRGRVAT